MTLACEDANSKLIEVVTDADADDEDRVDKSLLQIWKLRFGHKAFVQTLSTLVKILKLNLDQYSEASFSRDADVSKKILFGRFPLSRKAFGFHTKFDLITRPISEQQFKDPYLLVDFCKILCMIATSTQILICC